MKKEYQLDCLVNDGVTEEQLAVANEQVIFTAIMCQEAHRALNQSVGDYSIPSWDEATESEKDDAIDSVLFFLTEAADSVPENLPKDMHPAFFVLRAIARTMLGGGEA